MSKGLLLIIFSSLILGCMDQPSTFSSPTNLATALEQNEIEGLLKDIQKDFLELNVALDLKQTNIIVTDTISGDGRCVLSAENPLILLHPRLFNPDNTDPNLNQISRLWSVLVHEIGHCYFGRHHEDKHVYPHVGFVFKAVNKVKLDQGYVCFSNYNQVWPGTLMGEGGLHFAPESLKIFYLKELVGQVSHPKLGDILSHREVSLVDEVNATSELETVSCH